jgi:alanyl-tRNA synthetase
VASGIRRIEAVTGPRVAVYAQEKEQEQYAYAQLLDCTPKQLTERIQKLLSSIEHIQQQHEHLQQHVIKQTLLQCPISSFEQFSYIIDIDTL